MVVSLECVYEDILSEPVSAVSLVVEKHMTDIIGTAKGKKIPYVPNFRTHREAVVWFALYLIMHDIPVIFKSRNGNEREMRDIREMVFEVYQSRRQRVRA